MSIRENWDRKKSLFIMPALDIVINNEVPEPKIIGAKATIPQKRRL